MRTTTFRVALVYIWLFTASVLIILGAIYYTTAGFLDRQAGETIAAELEGLREQYRQRGLRGLAEVIEQRSRQPRTNALYLFTDPRLNPIAGNLSHWPEVEPEDGGWIEFVLADAPAAGNGEIHGARARVFVLPGGFRLLVGRDLRERGEFQDRLVFSLAWAVVLTIGLGTVGGVLISRDVMRRVDAINRTTRKIMTGELHQRIVVSAGGDELDELARNLNAMLDRIERLMQEMRHVAESVAHDLRTPLTRLRSRMELALLETRGQDAARSALQDALGEADRLLATFQALLSIAEAEAGHQQAAFSQLDLAGLVREMVELYEPVAEEKGVALGADLHDAPIRGHRHLLAQAVANLLDNAVKYTPAGGRIAVSVRPGAAPGSAELAVADSGPGIPADERGRVLHRFVRLERSRSTPGNGLGLSMVDAVARLHGAELVLDDNEPGLAVSLRFGQPFRSTTFSP
ncbi:sensor histidine kinase [Arenibaculum sp.]|uniref:sensor histidine kinase n=1 Tax=Arenibaculum sp. TaxID=2865862 RepID=UPI002E159747|nr:ATP-binding protein [Arenibaculum sp.]